MSFLYQAVTFFSYKADFPPFNDLSGLRSTDRVFWVASWVAQW